MDTAAIYEEVAHRQTPMPGEPWILRQSWQKLLFAHWPVSAEILRPLIPRTLTLDTYEQEAWVGVVPFEMREVCPRGIPTLPALSESPELNVRTYVTAQGIPGVYFFSLDAANPLFVAMARTFFQLPYFKANMQIERQGKTIDFRSQRTRARDPQAVFQASYRPTGPIIPTHPGNLAYWLTERYCLYTVDRRQQVYRVDIHHAPWQLQPAEWECTQDTMAHSHGIQLPDTKPLLHYAERQDTLTWMPRRVK
jgi:uncharacterized protein YqjF (DUF2071 family)